MHIIVFALKSDSILLSGCEDLLLPVDLYHIPADGAVQYSLKTD